MKYLLLVAAALSGAGLAQTTGTGSDAGKIGPTDHARLGHMSATGGAMMTAAEVGMQPMAGVSPPEYVRMAADSDMYEMASSKLALARSKNPQIRQYAEHMIRDHTTTTQGLKTAVKESKSPKPPIRLSAEKQALLTQLRTSGNNFDRLYVQQQLQSHQQAWALHKGFADSNADPALGKAAVAALPLIEGHIRHARQLQSGMPMAMR